MNKQKFKQMFGFIKKIFVGLLSAFKAANLSFGRSLVSDRQVDKYKGYAK